jgi:hypothetical protein
VTDQGLLVHKESSDGVSEVKKISGKLLLLDCDWFRSVRSVKRSDVVTPKIRDVEGIAT